MSLLLFFSGQSLTPEADAGRFVGALQGVAVLSEALTLADVQSLVASALWTDVTDDLDAAEALVVDRGIHEDSPLNRIAATSLCTGAFDNSERNSAGLLGYYSPGHANARAGFDRGTFIRVSMLADDGSLLPQFLGKIRSVKPSAGEYRDRIQLFMATDWLDEAARFPVEGIETQENIRADQLLELLVDSMRNRPHALAFETGSDVYPFALDNSTDQRSHSIQQEAKRIVDSERGLLYVTGDGTLTFESRYARTLATSSEYVLTDVLDADQGRAIDDIVNRVTVRIYKRRIDPDATTVLYSSDSPIRVDHGMDPVKVFLPFRDPEQEATRIGALDIVDPLSVSPLADIAINSEDDATGVDLTTHPGITVAFTLDATGVYMVVTNLSGYRAHFTTLQIRGRGLYHYDTMPLIAENRDSIRENGLQEVEFDMPYQDRLGVGQGTANLTLNMFEATPTKVGAVPFYLYQSEVHQRLGAYGEISTRLTYEELMAGVNADFFINAKRIEWRPGDDVDVTVWLQAADTQHYAVFDVDRFDDVDARFAY